MQNVVKTTLVLFLVLFVAACGDTKKKELSQLDQAKLNSLLSSAKMEMLLQHYPAAEKAVEDALKLVPDNAALWSDLAQIRMQTNNLAGAEKARAKAAELSPANDDYWFDLGIVRARLKDKSGARTAFQKCVAACEDSFKKNSGSPAYLTKQIRPLILLGRTDDARAVLAKAAKLFPANADIQQLVDQNIVGKFLDAPDYKELVVK